MCTWISRTAVGAALLALAACAPGLGVGVTRAAPESISVAGQSVVVAGPPGYCIDRTASGDRGSGAFVLLGSCAALAGDASKPHPADPGVLTVSVTADRVTAAEVEPLLAGLRDFFLTEEGRAALSRDGRPETVEILEARIEDGALLVHSRDTASRARGMAEESWRALLGIRGRLVTLSVNAPSARPLSPDAGYDTLAAFTLRVRAENRTDGAS